MCFPGCWETLTGGQKSSWKSTTMSAGLNGSAMVAIRNDVVPNTMGIRWKTRPVLHETPLIRSRRSDAAELSTGDGAVGADVSVDALGALAVYGRMRLDKEKSPIREWSRRGGGRQRGRFPLCVCLCVPCCPLLSLAVPSCPSTRRHEGGFGRPIHRFILFFPAIHFLRPV